MDFITKKELKDFREKADKMLEQLGKETGFKLSLGSIRYSENSFSGKLEAVKVNAGETEKDLEKKLFGQHCMNFGLKESDYGREFSYFGDTYIIYGVKPSGRKNTILVRRKDTGKPYVFPHLELLKIFRREV